MRTRISGKWTLGLVVAAAMLAAGCARLHEAPVHHAGSIKDTPPAGYAGPRSGKSSAPKSAEQPAKPALAAAPTAERGKPAAASETPVAAPPAAPSAVPVANPALAPVAPSTKSPEVRPTEAIRSATPPPPAAAADERATSRQLLEEGRKLFAEGKVVDARRRFIAALNGASPEATWALAQSFDSHYLALLPTNDGAADPDRALTLYKTAIERGAKAAQEDLDRIIAASATTDKPKQ